MDLAKRVRGQRSTHRPGGTAQARPERDATAARASESRTVPTSASTAAAVGTGQSSAVTASPVATTTTRSATATPELRPRTRLRSSGLEQKAAAETAWVTDDLRRIAVISAIMIAGLAIAWVLLVVLGLGDFY
jgi:hypothetical protein